MPDQPGKMDKLAERVEQEIGSTARALPPVDKWNPDFSGDMDMRIARNGDWYYQGKKLERQAMVKLFSSILRRDEDGEFYLVTPVEKFRILVEAAPFVAHSLEREGDGKEQVLWLTTNAGDRIRIDQDHPLWVEDPPLEAPDQIDKDAGPRAGPMPYVRVRRNLDALIERQTFYELAELSCAGEGANQGLLGVLSAGSFFSVGKAD